MNANREIRTSDCFHANILDKTNSTQLVVDSCNRTGNEGRITVGEQIGRLLKGRLGLTAYECN